MARNDRTALILLILGCLFFYLFYLGHLGVEAREDEVFYYQSAKQMYQSGDFLSPRYFDENRFQKPVLYYWFILLFYKLFGLTWFAARFATVLFAVGTIYVTYRLASRMFNHQVGLLSGIILMTMPMFYRQGRVAAPDMAMNFFIVLSLYFAYRFFSEPNKRRYSLGFFAASGLGFMVKGLAALIVPFGAVIAYCLFAKNFKLLRQFSFFSGTLLFLFIVVPWFIYMVQIHGSDYANYMLVSETQTRIFEKEFFKFFERIFENIFYYLGVMFRFSPWVLFFFVAIPGELMLLKNKGEKKPFFGLLVAWFFIVFVTFIIMKSSLGHYFLVLTTPFAIMVSQFILEKTPRGKVKPLYDFMKGKFFVVLFYLIVFLIPLLSVYIFRLSPIWILLGVLGVYAVNQYQDKILKNNLAPFLLGISLTIFYLLTPVVAKAGYAPYPVVKDLAEVVQKDAGGEFEITSASEDVHVNAVQSYFDQKVHNARSSDPELNRQLLKNVLNSKKPVYFYVLEREIERVLDSRMKRQSKLLEKREFLRRQLSLDLDFVVAFLKADHEMIREYLFETVCLYKKGVICQIYLLSCLFIMKLNRLIRSIAS